MKETNPTIYKKVEVIPLNEFVELQLDDQVQLISKDSFKVLLELCLESIFQGDTKTYEVELESGIVKLNAVEMHMLMMGLLKAYEIMFDSKSLNFNNPEFRERIQQITTKDKQND